MKTFNRERRNTKAYAAARIQLEEAETSGELLLAIATLLSVPTTKTLTPIRFDSCTGQPTETKWVVDKNSRRMQFVYILNSFIDEKLSDSACDLLQTISNKCDHKQLLFRVPKEDEGFYYLTAENDRVCTGGGHNESPTYADALVFKLAHPAKV